MLGIATAAGGFAFNTASSYVFRSDASTSTSTSTSTPNSPPPTPTPTPTQSPSKSRLTTTRPQHRRQPSHLPRSSTATPSSSTAEEQHYSKEKREGIALVDQINKEEDLYAILGVGRRAKNEEVRRQFLARSRWCHPDKLPDYPPATPAFQRLSYAYETLSKPSSRRLYDLGGGRAFDPGSPSNPTTAMGDETLNGVLRNVFTEFLAGDFEMIRVFVNALNEGNPGLNLGEETIDNLEGAFRRVREVVLSGQKYLRLIRFELIRLYQLQSDLRSLSYFDILGRLRLTLALTRVTLEIPMVLDRAMREEVVVRRPMGDAARTGREGEEGEEEGEWNGEGWTEGEGGELQRRGLLGPRVKGVLVLACKVLEKGERFGL